MSDSDRTQSATAVGPHTFRPLRFWDMRSGGRCRACYLPMSAHPVHCYVPARPLKDRTKAEVKWENLHA